MTATDEIVYSDQGRFKGMVKCGAVECTFWARTGQDFPKATADQHNTVKHGGQLTVTRVESAAV